MKTLTYKSALFVRRESISRLALAQEGTVIVQTDRVDRAIINVSHTLINI